jgi:addiction module RelE/StbE family toxin
MRLWRLDWTSRAQRGYRSLTGQRKRLVIELLEELQTDPHPAQAEPLKSSRELHGAYKVKIDGWRVVYRVKPQDGVIFILAIEPRSKDTYLNV